MRNEGDLFDVDIFPFSAGTVTLLNDTDVTRPHEIAVAPEPGTPSALATGACALLVLHHLRRRRR